MGCAPSKHKVTDQPVTKDITGDEKDERNIAENDDTYKVGTKNSLHAALSSTNLSNLSTNEAGYRARSVSIKTDDGYTVDDVDTSKKADVDAQVLYNAMRGLSTNINDLIEVIIPCHGSYRQTLKNKYEEKYNEDLRKEVKRTTSSSLQYLLTNLLLETKEFLVFLMKEYVDEKQYILLSELLNAWNSTSINEAKLQYQLVYGSTFESDVTNSLDDLVPKSFKDVIIPSCQLHRDESCRELDDEIIQKEADKLSQGSDDISALLVQTTYNAATLSAIFKSYKLKYYLDITDSIDIEFHDDTKRFLTTMVQVCEDSPKYFATQLKEAIKKNDEKRFINILIGRQQLDLSTILQAYEELHDGQTLIQTVSKHFSSDFGKAICLLLKKHTQ
ncbi:annexin A8-like protein 1 isoform X2 [Hydractinia symbiolongicarpus]|uniref:annexin A8-like protein 1 isoform X2 n=1 Tax=Hydractinia symbiolongicarpus TaxID=13093 RepID=UPI00254B1B47|nr:annexin A8-like protein 1 isoform X2 [Hydractinia symbiolongicarpus]